MKEKNIFNLENSKKNTETLLWELSKEISNNFWIEIEKAVYLIKKESIISLDSLRQELIKQKDKLENKKIEELYLRLKEIKNILEIYSKTEIVKLKNEVEEKIDIDNFKNSLEWKLSRKMINIAKKPRLFHEHLLWASLWVANSLVAIWESTIKILIWFIKSPYDLYLILSGKAEIENIKKI